MSHLIANPVAIVRESPGKLVKIKWQTLNPPSHEFLAAICPEEEGGFSVFAPRYPGIVSDGETVEEAKANIAEAFIGMLEACRKRGKAMEYTETYELPANCEKEWISVDG